MSQGQWTCELCGGLNFITYKAKRPWMWGIENPECVMCEDDSKNLAKMAKILYENRHAF